MKTLQVKTRKGFEEMEILRQHRFYGRDTVAVTKDGRYIKAVYCYKEMMFKVYEEYDPRYWTKGMIFRYNGLGVLCDD